MLLESDVTPSTLLALSVEILQEKGGIPVGEVGKMLQEATCNPTLTMVLKDKFGGLKKFLEIHADTFLIGKDHPFNPNVYLRQTLTEPEVALVQAGGTLAQNGPRRKKGGRKKKSMGHESELDMGGGRAGYGGDFVPGQRAPSQQAYNARLSSSAVAYTPQSYGGNIMQRPGVVSGYQQPPQVPQHQQRLSWPTVRPAMPMTSSHAPTSLTPRGDSSMGWGRPDVQPRGLMGPRPGLPQHIPGSRWNDGPAMLRPYPADVALQMQRLAPQPSLPPSGYY
jgi:hypothetical protein